VITVREIVGLIVGDDEPAAEFVGATLVLRAAVAETLLAAEGEAPTVTTVGVWLTELVTEVTGELLDLTE